MFQSVKPQRLSDEIVVQIREALFAGRLRPGDKLPTERGMAQRFQTSRTSVREALRRLEQEGLIHIKKGINGGVFISDIDHQPAARSIRTLLELRKVSIQDITEVRLIFEPMAARLAAEHATEDDIFELEEVVRKMGDAVASEELPRSYDLRFHQIIARASGNPVLQLLAETMLEVAAKAINELNPSVETIHHVVECHNRILGAVRSRDGEFAEKIMRDHIVDVQSRLAKHAQTRQRRPARRVKAAAEAETF